MRKQRNFWIGAAVGGVMVAFANWLVERYWGDVAVRGLVRYLRDGRGFIRPTDLVLDVGSGDRPHIRANLICDRYRDEETWEREGRLIVDRPLVIGDVHELPFRNKALDAVICQHLVEHLERPEVALRELERVGKRGLIRTPSPTAEKLFSRDIHRWLVTSDAETLLLQQKNNARLDEELNAALGSNASFWKFFGRNISLMETTHRWRERLDFRVERLDAPRWDGEPATEALAGRPITVRMKLRGLITALVGRVYRGVFLPRQEIVWEAILACPVCKCDLRLGKEAVCVGCGRRYPRENGSWVLLRERATLPQATERRQAVTQL